MFSEPPPCPTWSQTQGCFPCALQKAVLPTFPSPGVPSPSAASRPGVHPEGEGHRGCSSWAGIQDTVVARNSQHLLPSLGLSFSCGGLAFALEEFPRNLQDSRPVTRKLRCAQLTHRCSQCSLCPYRVRGRGASCGQAPLLLSWSRRFAGGGELGGCWGPSECWVSRSGGEWTPGGVPLVRSQEGAGSTGWGETVAPGLPRSGRSLSKIGLPLQLLL